MFDANELFEYCKSRLLVTSYQNFKLILNELIDHRIIKSVKNSTKEVYKIETSAKAFEQFINVGATVAH